MKLTEVARGLGWFSLGLALAEVVMPRGLGRFLGTRKTGLLRLFGLREGVAGLGILLSERQAPWVWARVAGDALDLAALAAALGKDNPKRGNALFATAAVLGVTALDVLCARELSADNA